MIDSRTHAALDVCLTAGLAGVAACPAVAPRARWAAGLGALYQAGCSATTAYEGGVVPILGMQQHRALQLLGATALGTVGALRAREGGGRALLALAVAQAALATLADGHAHAGPPATTYTPLDTPKRLARDLWIVDSVMRPGLPVRMTVIRLENGDLILHSPTRFSAGLGAMIEQLGRIRHLVAPNLAHWMFVKGWQDEIADVTVWAAPGLARRGTVRRSGLRIDADLADTPPAAWVGAIEQAVIPGGCGFSEVVMLHRPSRTVLMTDLVQNFEPDKLPWVLRPIVRLLGNVSPEGRAPAHLRALMRLGPTRAAAAAARRVIAWAPERVVVTHGAVIERAAAARLRRSLAWLAGD